MKADLPCHCRSCTIKREAEGRTPRVSDFAVRLFSFIAKQTGRGDLSEQDIRNRLIELKRRNQKITGQNTDETSSE
jgi:hypothetical protein